jgi:YARHG domain-containing protein
MRIQFALLSVAFSALSAVVATSPAKANCYENFGCTDSEYFVAHQLEQVSCQVLWEVRNIIFKERGYCFGTAKAVKAFGNAGCLYHDVARVQRFRARQYQRDQGGREQQGLLTVGEQILRPEKSTVSGPGLAHSVPASVVGHGRACLLAFLSLLPVSPRL